LEVRERRTNLKNKGEKEGEGEGGRKAKAI